jgi:hypothetical protein
MIVLAAGKIGGMSVWLGGHLRPSRKRMSHLPAGLRRTLGSNSPAGSPSSALSLSLSLCACAHALSFWCGAHASAPLLRRLQRTGQLQAMLQRQVSASLLHPFQTAHCCRASEGRKIDFQPGDPLVNRKRLRPGLSVNVRARCAWFLPHPCSSEVLGSPLVELASLRTQCEKRSAFSSALAVS